jgi:Homing endonuclease associated repeat
MPQKRRPQGGRSRRRPEGAGTARRSRPINAVRRIDPAKLAEFQAGIRKRYSDEDILEQLRASAERLGRSPTMREFEDDSETTVHPQTVIQHFGSWNEAKRKAGLVPRRFAEPADLIRQLRELGEELGRPPTARDLDEHRESMPSKSLYWHMFGSLKNALREAGFDLPVGEERLERAIEQGVALARELGRLPKFADWKAARQTDSELMSEWQVYRMLEPGGGPAARAGEAGTGSSGRRRQVGAWATFQYLVRERLLEEGTDVSPEGSLRGRRRSKPGAGGTSRPRAARARPAATPPRKRDRG